MVEVKFYPNGQISIHKDDVMPEELKVLIDWEAPSGTLSGDFLDFWLL
jgi:hypothetical protein